VSISIDFTYLIFCGLQLNVRREGIEGEERKRREGRWSKGVRQVNFRNHLVSVKWKTN